VYNVTLSKDGKLLTLQFNEPIFNSSISKTRDAELKAAIKFDGSLLKVKDSVKIIKDSLNITLFQPILYDGTYSVTINEGALKDVAGNAF
jgi:hypothetical protein